jgi:hypothetical protein
MAKTAFSVGFFATPELKEALRKAASTLPEDWTVEMAGSSAVRSFTVRVDGPGVKIAADFGPDDAATAVRLLEGLKPRQP